MRHLLKRHVLNFWGGRACTLRLTAEKRKILFVPLQRMKPGLCRMVGVFMVFTRVALYSKTRTPRLRRALAVRSQSLSDDGRGPLAPFALLSLASFLTRNRASTRHEDCRAAKSSSFAGSASLVVREQACAMRPVPCDLRSVEKVVLVCKRQAGHLGHEALPSLQDVGQGSLR